MERWGLPSSAARKTSSVEAADRLCRAMGLAAGAVLVEVVGFEHEHTAQDADGATQRRTGYKPNPSRLKLRRRGRGLFGVLFPVGRGRGGTNTA